MFTKIIDDDDEGREMMEIEVTPEEAEEALGTSLKDKKKRLNVFIVSIEEINTGEIGEEHEVREFIERLKGYVEKMDGYPNSFTEEELEEVEGWLIYIHQSLKQIKQKYNL